MMKIKFSIFLFCLLLVSGSCACSFALAADKSPVPEKSSQMIVVVTDSIPASKGTLLLYERKEKNKRWKKTSCAIAVALGKNGVGWGLGLHNIDAKLLGVKKEGDKKSPAGVFTLGPAFGFASKDSMKNLKIHYLPIEAMMECIDDTASLFYNEIMLREAARTPDWRSSEKMARYGKWYDHGIVIDHNKNPVKKGAGSCVFIHNWVESNETTSGCIEMEPSNLNGILQWLDSSRKPVIVILPRQLYKLYRHSWALP
jgi:D-alanyl-D-alanine dipeptidase